MPILQVMVVLVLVGVGLWAINRWVPMQPAILKILNIAVVVIVILWLVSVMFPGLWASLQGVRLPVRR